ncbi:hypothetical protein SAMN02983003_1673 [Devosia enhydra]|uniref:Uncharacterized protein n=2 Tax=Devosia enhydra TaxID=665118 RepID=A0A1K2HWM0_9HYPH|nr:hypothetical protein SAMN02983003_1673 [Devosia enhydra]
MIGRFLLLSLSISSQVSAQSLITRAPERGLIDSYIAQINYHDLFNSSGVRLTEPAAIIRQDRANYHRFGRRDPLDEGDTFFADAGNRQALETMLLNGEISLDAAHSIIDGGAVIQVEIYGRGPRGDWVEVTVLN